MFRFEDGIYYFQRLPPDVGSLDLSADRPKTKYAHEDALKQSVYFHWWRYLGASSEYPRSNRPCSVQSSVSAVEQRACRLGAVGRLNCAVSGPAKPYDTVLTDKYL